MATSSKQQTPAYCPKHSTIHVCENNLLNKPSTVQAVKSKSASKEKTLRIEDDEYVAFVAHENKSSLLSRVATAKSKNADTKPTPTTQQPADRLAGIRNRANLEGKLAQQDKNVEQARLQRERDAKKMVEKSNETIDLTARVKAFKNK